MTGQEIKERIDFYTQKIYDIMNPVQFTLNREVIKYNKLIRDLRKVCPHEYENHKCIYCGMPQEEQ